MQKYLITSAQNNTNLDYNFWATLTYYSHVNNCEIIVIPYLYRNPTSPSTIFYDGYDEPIWDINTQRYLIDSEVHLNNSLTVKPSKIQPTKMRPLAGRIPESRGKSLILGHPKYEFRTIPAYGSYYPRIATTTGSATVPNYSDSDTGDKGKFHHVQGAIYVEILNERLFNLRHLNACNDGSFIDLGWEYKINERKFVGADYLRMGDMHYSQLCQLTHRASLKLIVDLKIKDIIQDDVFDAISINPHETHTPFKKTIGLQEELDLAVDYLKGYSRLGRLHVTPANHDTMLRRWVEATDWRKLPHDLGRLYLRLASLQMDDLSQDLFAIYAQTKLENVHFIRLGESLKFHEVENALHGDKGKNGSRGSLNQFATAGEKYNLGHSHSPAAYLGTYVTGCSCKLHPQYTLGGLNGWLNSHIIGYPNGKRQLIHFLFPALDV